MLKSKIFWGLIITGALIAIVIVYLYAAAITQSWYLAPIDSTHWLSPTSEAWGNFGSLLSGAFTLLSSTASLATLIFLLYQQKDDNEANREKDRISNDNRVEQLRIQGEIQEKNDKHLEEEKKLIVFEMYKIHKDMFDDLLDKIEVRLGNKMRFNARSVLYKQLFSTNGFYEFNATSDYGSYLSDVESCLKKIVEILPQINGFIGTTQLPIGCIEMNRLLGIEYIADVDNYDITMHGKNIGLNALKIRETLGVYFEVFNEIVVFSENKPIPEIELPEYWMNAQQQLIEWGLESLSDNRTNYRNELSMTLGDELVKPLRDISSIFYFCKTISKDEGVDLKAGEYMQDFLFLEKGYYTKPDALYKILQKSLSLLNNEMKQIRPGDDNSDLVTRIGDFSAKMQMKVALRH